MIRVTIYFDSGRESNSHDCKDVQDAYQMCVRYRMLAHAVNLENDNLYVWRPALANTWEAFTTTLLGIPLTMTLRDLISWVESQGFVRTTPTLDTRTLTTEVLTAPAAIVGAPDCDPIVDLIYRPNLCNALEIDGAVSLRSTSDVIHIRFIRPIGARTHEPR